jgi:CxxC-x17-CxxC domain-containing protein
MGDFNRKRSGGGGRRSYGRGGFGGGGGRGRGNRPQMYTTLCDECGIQCEVPFRPTGDKPVYCNDCFSRGKGRRDSFTNDAPKSQQSNISKEQFEILNTKLDKILKLVTPVFVVTKEMQEKAEQKPEPKKKALKKSKVKKTSKK